MSQFAQDLRSTQQDVMSLSIGIQSRHEDVRNDPQWTELLQLTARFGSLIDKALDEIDRKEDVIEDLHDRRHGLQKRCDKLQDIADFEM